MVLVKPASITSELTIPDTAFKDLQSQFDVVAVGKGKVKKFKKRKGFLLCYPEVKVGDRIVANTWAGTELVINGKPHRLIQQESVMMIVNLAPDDPLLAPEQGTPQFGSS